MAQAERGEGGYRGALELTRWEMQLGARAVDVNRCQHRLWRLKTGDVRTAPHRTPTRRTDSARGVCVGLLRRLLSDGSGNIENLKR